MTSLDQNTPLSADRLAKIRERERMATEGPWVRWTDQERIPGWDGFFVVGDDAAEGEECNPTARVYIDPDAEFIAHARQDVPDLLAEVDRLKQQVEFLTDVVNGVGGISLPPASPVQADPDGA